MKTSVLGLGNVLMGDDAFGPTVVAAFDREYAVGPDDVVADLGTPGFDLLPWLADAGHVVIVDTIASASPPGTVRLYSKRDLLRHLPPSRVSPHDPGLKEAVLTLEFAGRAPLAITIVGVVPARMSLGRGLSDPVACAVPQAVDAVVAAVKNAGCSVARRLHPSVERAWWVRLNAAVAQ